MGAILYRMAAGIPGALNRVGQATVETHIMDAAAPVTGYGLPCKLVSGKLQPVGAGDAAADVYGFLVRPYPTQGTSNEALGAGTPSTIQPADVMVRGYMMVKLGGATAAAKGGAVYVRVAAASAGKPIGGIEAAADSANTIAVAGCIFTGPADADGNTEIRFNI